MVQQRRPRCPRCTEVFCGRLVLGPIVFYAPIVCQMASRPAAHAHGRGTRDIGKRARRGNKARKSGRQAVNQDEVDLVAAPQPLLGTFG